MEGLSRSGAETRLNPGDMTPNAFWDRYGPTFDPTILPQESFNAVWNFAEANSPDFEQHNFDHTRETLWEAMELADYCEENGQTVDRVALVLAALFHDIGEGQDYETAGFASAEELAAAVCGAVAASLDPMPPEETVATARQAILDTHVDAEPRALESIIMVNADLQNVGENYEQDFLPVTKRLWREKIRRTAGRASEVEFLRSSIKILRGYLAKDLSLGPFDRRDWQKHAIENVDRLGEELLTVIAPIRAGKTAARTIIDLLPLNERQ